MITTLYVHAGRPHADDVFCAVIAWILGCEDIRRVNELPKDVDVNAKDGIIAADIGGGVYDHHGHDTPKRKDGVTHCAASRMWEYFGEKVIKTLYQNCAKPGYVAYRVDKSILSTIATYDNGEGARDSYNLCNIIGDFCPSWNSTKTMDDAFFNDMIPFMKGVLKRYCDRIVASLEAEDMVTEAINKMENGIVVLPRFAPWQTYVTKNKDTKWVVYPSIRGGWNVQGVTIAFNTNETRANLPKEWYGKSGAEAACLCEGMTFCHNSGNLAAFDTVEHAIAAVTPK